MPIIPLREQQVTQKPIAPSEPLKEAAGLDIINANMKLGENIQQLGQNIFDRVKEINAKKSQENVLALDTNFRKDVQNLLYSTDLDDKSNPKGILQRKLNQANNATVDFDKNFNILKSNYMNLVTDENQKKLLNKLIDNHYITEREGVIKHETNQLNDSFKNTLKTNLDQIISDSTSINNPELLKNIISNAQARNEIGLKNFGLDQETINLQNQILAGKIVKNSVNGIIEDSPSKAEQILKSTEKYIDKESALEIKNIIDGKLFSDKKNNIYNSISKFSLSDGMKDIGKMLKYVDNLKEYTTEEKQNIKNYVQAKAHQDNAILKDYRDSNDRNFTNDVFLAVDKQKTPLDQTLKLAGKYGIDTTDIAEKERFIMRLYKSDEKDSDKLENPEIYLTLWKDIKFNGKTNEKDLNNAYDNNLITKAHYYELVKEINNIKLNGIKNTDKIVWDRIEQLAPDYKKDKEEFLLTVKQETEGKSAIEAYKIAEDLSKKTGFLNNLFHFKENKLKKTAEEQKQKLSSLSEINQKIGKNIVGSFNNNPDNILKLANDYGGIDSLKIGTPVNNAIQSLLGLKKSINKANIDAVLSQYPDGLVPADVVMKDQ